MAWPKIKNIIILILLVTNLSLLVFTVSGELRDQHLQDEARSDAITFLKEQGVELDETMVPRSMTLTPQRVKRNVEEERYLAAALLAGEVSVDARGAEVYLYSNPNGWVQFHSNGEFSAQFASDYLKAGEEGLEAHALSVLERLNFQGSVTGRQEDGVQTSLTVRESWQDTPLLTCQAVLNYEGGTLYSITGAKRLVGTPEPDGTQSTITVATALMKFYTGLSAMGDVCSQISGLTQAYTVSSTLSGPMPLTPVWYITTDTGAYQLDLLTGTLSRTV